MVASALLALIPAYVAKQRGRSYGAFWLLSFAFTIFVGLLVVLALPEIKEKPSVARTDEDGNLVSSHTALPENITCPQCAETVKSLAKVCRFCGTDLVDHVANLKTQISANASAQELVRASQIAEEIKAEAEKQTKAELNKQWIRKHWYLPVGVIALLSAGVGLLVLSLISAEQDALRAVELEKMQYEDLVATSEGWEAEIERCEAWASVVELESTRISLHMSVSDQGAGPTKCLLNSVGFESNIVEALLASGLTSEEYRSANNELTAFNDEEIIRVTLQN